MDGLVPICKDALGDLPSNVYSIEHESQLVLGSSALPVCVEAALDKAVAKNKQCLRGVSMVARSQKMITRTLVKFRDCETTTPWKPFPPWRNVWRVGRVVYLLKVAAQSARSSSRVLVVTAGWKPRSSRRFFDSSMLYFSITVDRQMLWLLPADDAALTLIALPGLHLSRHLGGPLLTIRGSGRFVAFALVRV